MCYLLVFLSPFFISRWYYYITTTIILLYETRYQVAQADLNFAGNQRWAWIPGPCASTSSVLRLCGRHGGPCAHRKALREPKNVKHTCLSIQRKRWITCYLPRRVRTDVINCLVTFVLTVLPRSHWILCQILIMGLPIYRTYLYGRCNTYFTKNFDVVMSSLSFIVHMGLTITRKVLTKVCCA